MPSKKGFEQAYNAPASVDIDTHLIVTHAVTQRTNDKQELIPAIKKLQQLPDSLGQVDNLLADTGYFSEANVNACDEAQITPYIPKRRQGHNQPLAHQHQHEAEQDEPEGEPVEVMAHRLKTKQGKALYAKRKSTVETVFGIIKQVQGFRQFHCWGLESVQNEWNLVSIGWNLKRMQVLMG